MHALIALALIAAQAEKPEKKPEKEPEKTERSSIGVYLKVVDTRLTIERTVKGSPAEKAGIKAGDIILKVNGLTVKDSADAADQNAVVNEVTRQKVGELVKIRLKRGDREMTIEVLTAKRSDLFPDLKDSPAEKDK
jgi:carboxyl-terminal processing protease